MRLFQGGIDEVRPWVKVIGFCVNVNQVCGSFVEFYGLYGALQLPGM